ncbi:MAG: 16S rRNA (guanine(966)-N(2))-methyltransferase RsmD [Rhodocyclaceae bacterium]
MSRVRIIGGRWRSRLLEVAAVPGLRPTPDRVRETVFNWLGQDLTGLTVLDLFAGTGAMGFEAASRGASRVVMVEQSAAACAVLQQSAKTLLAEGVEIVRGDAVKFAQSTAASFDVIFLDPPYNKGLVECVAPLIGNLLAPGGWLYVEAERPMSNLGPYSTVRQGKAGQVYYQLMQQGER